jgi:hypothetical protein
MKRKADFASHFGWGAHAPRVLVTTPAAVTNFAGFTSLVLSNCRKLDERSYDWKENENRRLHSVLLALSLTLAAKAPHCP